MRDAVVAMRYTLKDALARRVMDQQDSEVFNEEVIR